MVLCSYWVKLLQITDKLDSYCGIKSISHVDSCDKWRNVWYGLLSHSADASCDKSPYHTLLHLSHSSIVRYTLLYHSSCPNRTVQECDKFEENNLSHCKNISWFSMFLFHEFFMVLCWYWVKLLQITNKLDSYCGIKSISHVDLCDKWRSVWYGLLSHEASAECDKSPYHTLLHLSHESTCDILFIPQ